MQRDQDHHVKRPEDAAADTDTASYEQPLGKQDPRVDRERRRSKMPHERDESVASTGHRLDESIPPSEHTINQAIEDVEDGLVDTDRRGVPDDVPSSKRNREP